MVSDDASENRTIKMLMNCFIRQWNGLPELEREGITKRWEEGIHPLFITQDPEIVLWRIEDEVRGLSLNLITLKETEVSEECLEIIGT